MKTSYVMNSVKAFLLGGFMMFASSCQKDIPVEALSLDKTTTTVAIGATVTLLPVIDPVDATNPSIQWSTGDVTIATVSDGVVTGVSLGTVTITVASSEDPALTATCEV